MSSARSQATSARFLPDLELHGYVLEERYRVGTLLAQSAMARVYSGTDLTLRQPRVIKVASGRVNCARLQREVDLHRRVAEKASGLVKLYDRGWLRSEDLFFAVFEYLDGQDLSEALQPGGTLALEQALQVAERVAATLEPLHAAGIFHRDIKPANIFLCRQGDVRLLDLGVARAAGFSPLTTPGEAVGTPPYMAYELVAHPEDVDGRTDVYMLGLVLAHMVAGPKALPWIESLDPEHFLGSLQQRPPVHRLAPWLPKDATEVIEKACQLAPDARYQSMTEFRGAVVALLDKEKEKQQRAVKRHQLKRWMLIGVGALMVHAAGLALGVLVGVQWMQRQLVLRTTHSVSEVAQRPADGRVVVSRSGALASGGWPAAAQNEPTEARAEGSENKTDGLSVSDGSPSQEKDMTKVGRAAVALTLATGAASVTVQPQTAYAKPEMCQTDKDCKKNEACKSAGSLGNWCAEEYEKCASSYKFTKRAPKPVKNACWIPYLPDGSDTGRAY